MTVLTLDHVGLTVAYLDRSVAFFRDVLGFRDGRRSQTVEPVAGEITGVAGAEIDHAFLDVDVDGLELELLRYRAPAPTGEGAPGPEVPGSMHLALRVEDLAAIVAAAHPYGWAPAGRPVTMTAGPRAGSTMTYLRDATGATLELIEQATSPA